MTTGLRGILFDLDGTLVDSLELILSSYRHTMRAHLGHAPPDDDWLRTMGTPLKAQLAAFADSSEQAEAMFDTYVSHNEENAVRLIRSFPGMRDAVEAIHRAGFRLAVVTSKLRENALRELRSCELDAYFPTLVSASDVERPKPHPEPVLSALRALDLPPADALFVGDSLYDLAAGRAAGVRTAAALWGPFDRDQLREGAPDHWLLDVTALLRLLNVDKEERHAER